MTDKGYGIIEIPVPLNTLNETGRVMLSAKQENGIPVCKIYYTDNWNSGEKTGTWIRFTKKTDTYRRQMFFCNRCGYKSRNQTRFCPGCGKPMKKRFDKNGSEG